MDGTFSGPNAGYMIIDVKVSLVSAEYIEEESSDITFRAAASIGVRNAIGKADPIMLEPIVNVEVVVPEENLGDVMGGLNSRSGKIKGIKPKKGVQVIDATVPLRHMFGYATDLRSMTQGRATHTMQFSHYEQIAQDLKDSFLVGY